MTEQLVKSQPDLTQEALPRPIQAETAVETPVETDRSFYLDRVPKRFLDTPVDESTGVPYPIYPSPNLPPVIWKKQTNTEREADWHHPFHPRAALIQGSIAEQALRGCRVQWVRYDEHHDGVGYHQTFAGPAIAEDEFRIFKTVVFASAGYIGDYALRFDDTGQHSINTLTDRERGRLLLPGVLTIDDSTRVRSFLIDYGTKHSIGYMKSDLIDELLHSGDLGRRQELAANFIENASEEVASRFNDEFKTAKETHRLPHQRTNNAARYVSNLLLIRRDGSRIVDRQIMRMLEHSLQPS